MLEQGGGEQEDAVLADPAGRAGAVVLLLEDHPLLQGRVTAAEFGGPGHDGQAGVGEGAFPLPVLLETVLRVHRPQWGGGRHVLGEERPYLVAECDGGVVELEVHHLPSWTGRALAAIDLAFMPPSESVPTSAL